MASQYFTKITLVCLLFLGVAHSQIQPQSLYRTFDVRQYGAKCDGSTNDSAAFSSAISAAIANSGGDVFVPASASGCLLHTTVIISSNSVSVELRGIGPSSIITTDAPLINLIEIRGTAPARIHDIQLTSTTTQTAGALIANYGGANKVAISSLTCSAGTATLTAGSAFTSLPSGALIAISGSSVAGFNGTYATVSISGSVATFLTRDAQTNTISCPAGSASGGFVNWEISANGATTNNNYSQIYGCTFAKGWIGIDWEFGGAYWDIHDNHFGPGLFGAHVVLFNSIADGDNASGNFVNNQMNVDSTGAAIMVNSGGGILFSENALIGNLFTCLDIMSIGGVSQGVVGGGSGQISFRNNWCVDWSTSGYAIRLSMVSSIPLGAAIGATFIENNYLDPLVNSTQNLPAIYVGVPANGTVFNLDIKGNSIQAPIQLDNSGFIQSTTISSNSMLLNRGAWTTPAINITSTGNNIQSTLVSNNNITNSNAPSYYYAGSDLVSFIDDKGDRDNNGTKLSSLPVGAANSSRIWCTDCSIGTSNACAGSGSGEFAHRISGTWKCYDW